MGRPKLYQCPSCNNKFGSSDIIEGVCPHCRSPVVARQAKIDKRLVTEYVVPDTRKTTSPVLKPISESTQHNYGEVISAKGATPIVMLKLKQREYTMIYVGAGQIVNWVYCPACQQKLFQNLVVSAAHVEQGHVCRKCKAKVVTIFTRDKPSHLT